MKKVFLLEVDPLMFKAWEIQLKNSSWELYALDCVEDFSFRVQDFAPSLIVVSDRAFALKPDIVSDIPMILLGDSKSELEPPFMRKWEKPLDISNLEILLDKELEAIS